MEYRTLGSSGTGTFGGNHPFFAKWGNSDVTEARNLVDLCLDAGVNLFDTADVYSFGQSEEILGQVLSGRRDKVLISTKAIFRMSDEPNDVGHSWYHLQRSVESSLKRLSMRHSAPWKTWYKAGRCGPSAVRIIRAGTR